MELDDEAKAAMQLLFDKGLTPEQVAAWLNSHRESNRDPEIRRDWAGSKHVAHYCRKPLQQAYFHEFWIPQIIVDGQKVAVGNEAEGDDHRPDCTVELAKFTMHKAAQDFARSYLASLGPAN